MSDLNIVLATDLMGDVPTDVQRRVFASMGIEITDWQERFLRDAQRPETGPCLRLLHRARSKRGAL